MTSDPIGSIEILSAFDNCCLKLRRDELLKCTFHNLNDASAFLLAGSLLLNGNQNLQSLVLYVGIELTTLGARAVSKAIKKSHVRCLHLYGEDTLSSASGGVRTLFVEAVKSVRHLVLRMDLLNTDVMRLGKALRSNRTLDNLSLSLEHVTSQGIRALCEGIRSSHISTLQVIAATPEVYEILFSEGIGAGSTIRQLYVSDVTCSRALSKVVPILHTLGVDGMANAEEGFSFLCSGLAKATHLKKLEMEDVPLTDQRMQQLSTALRKCRKLKVLEIQSDDFGEAGVAALIESWKVGGSSPSKLVELRLLHNDMGSFAIQQLLQASCTHPHLKELDVRTCHNVGYDALAMIAKELCHTKLSTFRVWVRRPKVNDEAQELAEPIVQQASLGLIQAVKSNFHLKQLSLEEIDLPASDKLTIEFYLKLNRSGRRLLREDSLTMSTVWCHVLAKCKDDANLMFYFLREQPALMSTFQSSTARNKRRRPYTTTTTTTTTATYNMLATEGPEPKRQRVNHLPGEPFDEDTTNCMVLLSMGVLAIAALVHEIMLNLPMIQR